MKYNTFILLGDGLKFDLGRRFGDQESARRYAFSILKELKEGNPRIMVIGRTDKDDRWVKLYNNWWKYRLLKFLGIEMKI